MHVSGRGRVEDRSIPGVNMGDTVSIPEVNTGDTVSVPEVSTGDTVSVPEVRAARFWKKNLYT